MIQQRQEWTKLYFGHHYGRARLVRADTLGNAVGHRGRKHNLQHFSRASDTKTMAREEETPPFRRRLDLLIPFLNPTQTSHGTINPLG